MFNFASLEDCKKSILAILSIPTGTDLSGVDYLLVNDWGGYKLAFKDPLGSDPSGKNFIALAHLPGCYPLLFNQAVLQLLAEGKLVQYHSPRLWGGLSLQILAGLPDREASFLPRVAAA